MSTSPGSVPPEPPSFEKRLPLALALMMLVLLGWQYFFKPAPAPSPRQPPAADAAPKVQVAERSQPKPSRLRQRVNRRKRPPLLQCKAPRRARLKLIQTFITSFSPIAVR